MTVPDTTITAAPAAVTNSHRRASFSFTASNAGVTNTFECALDGAAFAACTSPRSYSSLTGGSHTFQVRARERGGDGFDAGVVHVDGHAAGHDHHGVAGGRESTSTSASFSFTSTPTGATFQCSLDGAAFATCTIAAEPTPDLAVGSSHLPGARRELGRHRSDAGQLHVDDHRR